MKNFRFLLPFLLLLGTEVQARENRVFDALSMESKILGMERKFAIYLPPGYGYSQRSYPVLYLLHVAGDDQTGWVQFGEVQYIADRAFEEGTFLSDTLIRNNVPVRKEGPE